MAMLALKPHLALITPDPEMTVVTLYAHPPVSTPDPEIFQINDIITAVMPEVFTPITLPAYISPDKHVTLHCKVDSGAGRNSMQFHVFQTLFPDHIDI